MSLIDRASRASRTGSLLAAVALGIGIAGCGAGAERPQQTTTAEVETGRDSVQSGDRQGDGRPQQHQGDPPQVPGDASCDGARKPIAEDGLRRAEITLRCLTNAVRSKEGLPRLRFDERLARAAATRSDAMAEADFFGHYGPGDSSARAAVGRTAWLPEARSWLVGENIAWAAEGGATPARIMRSWLDSPTHRENILNEHFREIGIGAVAAVPKADARPGATVTQIFGVTGKAARAAQSG